MPDKGEQCRAEEAGAAGEEAPGRRAVAGESERKLSVLAQPCIKGRFMETAAPDGRILQDLVEG